MASACARQSTGVVLLQAGGLAGCVDQFRAPLILLPDWAEVRQNLDVAEAASPSAHRYGIRWLRRLLPAGAL